MAKASFGDVAVSGFLAFVAIVTLLWFFGVTLSVEWMTIMLVVFFGFALFMQEAVDRSVGFGLLTTALALLAVSVAPQWVRDPLVELVGRVGGLLGVEIGFVDPASFAVLALVFTVLMLIIRYRITGQKKSIRNAAVLAGNDFQLYIREYLTFARIVALTGLSFAVILFQQTGQVLGSFGDVAADVPYIVSNLATVLGGYLSLGGGIPGVGEVPLFGSLGPLDFLVMGILVISVAAAVDERGRGRMSQFLRNRGL